MPALQTSEGEVFETVPDFLLQFPVLCLPGEDAGQSNLGEPPEERKGSRTESQKQRSQKPGVCQSRCGQ